METFRYVLNDYWIKEGDPRLAGYPLLSGNPLQLIALITLYVVLVKQILPALMANRKPFVLRHLILAYNFINIVSSVYFFFSTVKILDYGRKLADFKRAPIEDTEWTRHVVWLGAWYFASKLFDLLETIFFVLRHKQNQVTFLHVYHHSAVPLIVWASLKVAPTSGPAGLFPVLNSAVHAIMYTYYFFAALGPQYQKYLWWKKYITKMQLVQFVLLFVYGVVFNFFQSGFPTFFGLLYISQAPLFFLLFFNFYRQAYAKSQKAKSM